MVGKLSKSILLGLLLVLCMSVAVAADVSEDTASDIAVPSDNIEVEETSPEVQSEVLETEDTTDPYTFTNTTLDITGNNYDGQTLTLQDNVNVISSNNMQLTGTAFVVNGNNVNITGLKIVNANLNTVVITVTGSNVNINGNNILVNKTEAGETRAVYVFNSTNVNISNNVLSVYAVPQASGWDNSTGEWLENMKVSAVKSELSSNVKINDNTVTVTKSVTTGDYYSSTDAITIKKSNDTLVERNTVTIDGSAYIYGISATYFNNNITVFNNTIGLTGTNYICGVQFSSTSNSKASYNKITGTCTATSGACPSYEAFAYGIISLTGTWGASTSEAVGNIIEYNNVTLDSTIAYAYELSNAENNIIHNNTATVTGNVVMALGIYNSSNNNITDNTFTVTGNTTTLNGSIYEAVPPETTGIKIVDDGYNNTYNNTVIGNIINVTDSNNADIYSVILGNMTYNNTIEENYLKAGTKRNVNLMISDQGNNNIGTNYRLI